MSSPRNIPSSRLSQSHSLPNRLSQLSTSSSTSSQAGPSSSARTPTPTQNQTQRRRQSSHLRSSLFDPPINHRMSPTGIPQSSLSPLQANGQIVEGEVYHKDHTTVSFEWQIAGLEWLKKSLEEVSLSGWNPDYEAGNTEILPELLRRGVVIGDGWYKLDLARTATSDERAEEEEEPACSLTLYISSPALESSTLDFTFSSSIFIGIRPSNLNIGTKYSSIPWAWYSNTEHEFTKDTEYKDIALPPIDELLEMKSIKDENGFTLCVQISSPMQDRDKSRFIQPGKVESPQSVIEGLVNLIDSPSGDVKFVCLEHATDEVVGEERRLLSRKRTIYAHSEILKARSEYFSALLEGGFKEGESSKGRVTVSVDDAGFDTVYWLLRFIYTNQLVFADIDDVRFIMDTLQLDKREIHKLLSSRFSRAHHHSLWPIPGEWDFRHIPTEGEVDHDGLSTSRSMSISELELKSEIGAARRSVSNSSAASGGRSVMTSPPPTSSTILKSKEGGGAAAGRTPSAMVSSVTSRRLGVQGGSASMKLSTSSSSTVRNQSSSSSSPAPKKQTSAISTPTRQQPPTSPQTLPRNGSHHLPLRLSDLQLQSSSDPHAHPAIQPRPAPALAVYMLAHRYRIQVLEDLAKERILKGLTVENCMPMLLATHAYERLHLEVLEFVVDYFTLVQVAPEFQICIKEVSGGVWGETGGDVLFGLFRKL